MYKQLVRPLLFQFDPEFIHNRISGLLHYPVVHEIVQKIYKFEGPQLARDVFGIRFKNPVGLAAGFDKNAEMINGMAACGFGFIEIGTVTPRPQSGNPKPRLFRLQKDEALINRMGFNNSGVEVIASRLKNRDPAMIVGGNIGKNKDTPNEDAHYDYIECFKVLFDSVDYFVINVSSPNTPNLRQLQDKEQLRFLLSHLQNQNAKQNNRKPILLKIAPDLNNGQLDDIIEITKETKIDGIVATNTTIMRDGLKTNQKIIEAIGAGGLSGKPLRNRSTQVIRYIHQNSSGNIPIIGAGGIHSAEDALEKIKAGATLVQLYTGYVYEGPLLVKKIKQELIKPRHNKL